MQYFPIHHIVGVWESNSCIFGSEKWILRKMLYLFVLYMYLSPENVSDWSNEPIKSQINNLCRTSDEYSCGWQKFTYKNIENSEFDY